MVGGVSSDRADTAEQDSQTTRLCSAGLLNHHHSSHLYDHHLFEPQHMQRPPPPSAADGDNKSGSRPLTSDAPASCY